MTLNESTLKQLEGNFLMRYPAGFADQELQKMVKKHRLDKMVELTREAFSPQACSNVHVSAENMIKVISRSSMISMFEKPKFRDFVRRMDEHEKAFLVNALSNMLHGKQQAGFEAMVDLLATEKLAKWSLLTIIPHYYSPTKEIFVKPTTTKNILRYFEVEELVYKPTPSWDFYKRYRKLLNQAKTKVSKNLSPSNAAFTGFLMMTTQGELAAP